MNYQQWVAIVDDDAFLRASLARILRYHGITSHTFGSAEEYLGRLVDGQPRCIVLDVHLEGGLNGFELQKRLEAEGKVPPIIFMTGHPETILELKGRNGDAVDYLPKPFDTNVLIARVQAHLERALSPTPP